MDNIFSLLSSGVSAIVPFVVLLGILIFVHELGHFLVARWCGVKVEVFSLGFGKKILQHKRGDTVYAISIIPLGGYVKMFGEQSGEGISEEEKAVSFTHKTVWQRMAIVLAGPLMNFFFAILIFFFVGMIGEENHKPVIGDIDKASFAYKSGFRSGDTLKTVNGQEVRSLEDFQKALLLQSNQDTDLSVTVEREGTGQKEELKFSAPAKENPNPVSRHDFVVDIEGLLPYSLGTTVGVIHGSVAASLGLKTGDQVTAINGVNIIYWRELETVISTVDGTQNIELKTLSQGKEGVVTIASLGKKSITLKDLGIESSELYLGSVMKDSPAEKAGLKVGDRMVAVGSTQIQKWEDLLKVVKSFDGSSALKFTVDREGQKQVLDIKPNLTKIMTPQGREEKRFAIGISPTINIAASQYVKVYAGGFVPSIKQGIDRTLDVSVMTVLSFARLFAGDISPKNIGGVISIGQAAHETFKIGISQFLQMMGLISVNLFILNLLPVPVLDGGHLVFYTIEALKGSPLSGRKMEVAQQVGLAILMSLMVFALFNDVTRLIGL